MFIVCDWLVGCDVFKFWYCDVWCVSGWLCGVCWCGVDMLMWNCWSVVWWDVCMRWCGVMMVCGVCWRCWWCVMCVTKMWWWWWCVRWMCCDGVEDMWMWLCCVRCGLMMCVVLGGLWWSMAEEIWRRARRRRRARRITRRRLGWCCDMCMRGVGWCMGMWNWRMCLWMRMGWWDWGILGARARGATKTGGRGREVRRCMCCWRCVWVKGVCVWWWEICGGWGVLCISLLWVCCCLMVVIRKCFEGISSRRSFRRSRGSLLESMMMLCGFCLLRIWCGVWLWSSFCFCCICGSVCCGF